MKRARFYHEQMARQAKDEGEQRMHILYADEIKALEYIVKLQNAQIAALQEERQESGRDAMARH